MCLAGRPRVLCRGKTSATRRSCASSLKTSGPQRKRWPERFKTRPKTDRRCATLAEHSPPDVQGNRALGRACRRISHPHRRGCVYTRHRLAYFRCAANTQYESHTDSPQVGRKPRPSHPGTRWMVRRLFGPPKAKPSAPRADNRPSKRPIPSRQTASMSLQVTAASDI